MLKKTERPTLVFAFHTTADAMHAEAVFKENQVSGRLIPTPRSLSAGCGLAWAMPPELRTQAEELLTGVEVYPEQTEILLLRF